MQRVSVVSPCVTLSKGDTARKLLIYRRITNVCHPCHPFCKKTYMLLEYLCQLGLQFFAAEITGHNLALRVDEQVVGNGVDLIDLSD